jgi:DNA polymerase-3 subunit delta'
MWRGILGHDDVVERFRRTLQAGRLASTYLFVGPEGIGKVRFARELAKALLCPALDDQQLAPCDACDSCRLFDAGTHPDFEQLGLLPDKSMLAIAQFVGEQEQRNKEGLCVRISRKPYLGGRRVAIIDDADFFSEESANCLLKTLEEPPPHSLIILIGTSLTRQLPTIRSRAQIVPFRALPSDVVGEVLLAAGIASDSMSAAQLAVASGGSLTRARELAEPEMWAFHQMLVERLTRPKWDILGAEKAINDFVQAAGKEPSVRRERLRTLIESMLEYYRRRLNDELRAQAEAEPPAADELSREPPASFAAVEASLAAIEQVNRNANQALVVGNWLANLAGMARPVYPLGV